MKVLSLACMAVGAHAFGTKKIELLEDHTSLEWMIKAFASAGPSILTERATVMDGSMKVLREGDNGWSCMPANPRGMPEDGFSSIQEAVPVCFDSAGMEWMQAWMAQTKPELSRDAFIWMLGGDMGEDNTTPGVLNKEDASDPDEWIVSGPHLMLMPKDLDSISTMTTDWRTGEPYVMMAGTDYAHVMIPVEGYYKFQEGMTSLEQPPEPNTATNTDEWRIWAYSTAAPPEIGSRATILDGQMNPIREGQNGWTCMAANPRGEPEEGFESAHQAMPLCTDSEGFKWIQAWFNKAEPQLERPAFMWMLHGDMGEDNSTPGVLSKEDALNPDDWIESGPHLMLMPVDASSLDNMTTDFTTGEPFAMFQGDAFAHVMIPVDGYLDYYNA